MTKNYTFGDGAWLSDFIYARSPHTRKNVKYNTPCDGILRSEYNPEIDEHDYISVISKEIYGEGTEIKTRCSFSGTGAPCLVFTNELGEGEDFPEYRLHFEVCIYSGGVNVWHILPNPERVERPIRPTKIYFEKWEVNQSGVDCTVKFGKKCITVYIEGREFTVSCEDFPEKFRVGFTSCEGPCAFHSFSVSN